MQRTLKIITNTVENGFREFFQIINDILVESGFQVYILTKKNLILYWRRLLTTLVQICAPIFIILLLLLLGVIINIANTQVLYPNPYVLDNTQFVKCQPWGGNNTVPSYCYSIVYAHNNNAFSIDLMNRIMTQYSLTSNDVLPLVYEQDLVDFIKANPNITQTGISFSNSTRNFFGKNQTIYTIYYNITGDIPNVVPLIQNIFDNMIAKMALENLGIPSTFGMIQNNLKGMPQPPTRRDGQSIIFAQSGANFFSLSTMFILITVMYYVVQEKESKIRIGMMMMGLKNMPYWISWFICAMGINILASLVTIVFGLICRISFFTQSNFFVLFLMFTTFGMSLISLAFLLSAFVRTSKAALILGFIIFSISFILNLFLTNGSISSLLYDPASVFPFPILLQFYPPFNFAKMFIDISRRTLLVYDPISRSYINGPGFAWEDFSLPLPQSTFSIPAPVMSMYYLWGNTALFLILAWYFDYVMPTSVHQKSPFFFLNPSFWGISLWQPKFITLPITDLSLLDEDIKEEWNFAREKKDENILRIVGLGKTFGGILGKLGVFKPQVAVNDLNLHIKSGTCLALLGHNGAGKTTTINILVGLLKSDTGDAMVNGKSVKYNMDAIRKTLGVCPQHDILWDELTAREHLQLFAEFKGMSRKDIKAEVDQRLTDVDLLYEGNLLAGTFSGGMKRRLSVGIASIGNPDVILLDEPTTGMDPHSRRKVWKLIEQMKGKKAILLTTHSMEEADALSDRIGIMANGSLRCVGDSLHLKNKYGAGYNLSLVVDPTKEKEVFELLKSKLPEYELVSNNAGSVIINIFPKFINQLSNLLEEIEEITLRDKSFIRDWGISHTTLEEVYLKVTHEEFLDFNESDEETQTPTPPTQDVLVAQK